MKNRLFNTLLILAAFLLTCLAIAGGSYFRTSLTLQVGQISDRRVKAISDVENRIATERNRARAQEAAERMPAILMIDRTVLERVTENLNSLFTRLDIIRISYEHEVTVRAQEAEEAARRAAEEEAARLEEEERRLQEAAALAFAMEEYGTAPPPEEEPLEEQDEAGTEWAGDGAEPEETEETEETEPEPFASLEAFSALSVILTESQQLALVTMSNEDFYALYEAAHYVAGYVLEQGVSELESKTFLAVQDGFGYSGIGEESAEIGYEIVAAYLMPNVVVNEEATMREREKIAENYEVVMLQREQTIVDEGEPISEEAWAVMESLGMLGTGLENRVIPMTGIFTLVAVIFVLSALYLNFFHKSMAANKKEAFLLFTLYIMVLAVIWTLSDFDYPFLPLLIFPMLVSILIDTRASIVLTAGLTAIAYYIVDGSLEYLLFFMTAGTMICLFSRYTTERAKVFGVGLLVTVAQFVISLAVSLIIEKNHSLMIWPSILTTAGFAALNGMLTVIICMGSLPFWEVFFGVVTPVKLLDLTNPTNALLRRLTIEAPGTYHHSLIVANLAETAAYDIGANPHTARAGGYYHDIGKLKYPQYFAENLAGENPHDHLDPYNSVQLIVSHVAYGLTLATEYKLPQFLREIIREHHGTSLIQFFYSKAKNGFAEDEVDEREFRYPYTIPQTRESACVMLADTVEAAVRSMIPRVKNVDEVQNEIKALIRHKLYDGQLAESQLSIKDVATIEDSFYRVLKGMYHERISYPKLEPEAT